MRQAFIRSLMKAAIQDEDVMLLTGDLGYSVFDEFKDKFANQYINVGVSEQNMIGIAAGLALEGKKVFVYSIATFLLYRAFEQIRNDLCYQRLPVKLVGVGGGVLYGTHGWTHHSPEDLSVASCLAELMVYAPGDPLEVEQIIMQSLSFNSPAYIRLNGSNDQIVHSNISIQYFAIGKPAMVRGKGHGIAILAVGNMLPVAANVFQMLEDENVESSVYSIHSLKPIDSECLSEIIERADMLVLLEEHCCENGLIHIIDRLQVKRGNFKKVIHIALPNRCIHTVGSQRHLRSEYALNDEAILSLVRDAII